MQPQAAAIVMPPVSAVGSANPPPPPAPEPATASVPLAIHEHELLRRIGRGAYGEVWLARNALGTYRAVKVVYRKDFEDSRPFEREFRGIQKFEPVSRSHPGLVHILQVGRHPDYFYYVMELADPAGNPKSETPIPKENRSPNLAPTSPGAQPQATESSPPSACGFRNSHLDYVPRTLRQDLRRNGRLPIDRCVEVGLSLTSSLAHLHRHGLVHRDVKPSNIILVGGQPKLADIGLVTDAGDSQSIVGTEGYLPPEGPGTPQADMFSLGKVLYELSTGQDRLQFPDLPPDLNDRPDRRALLELNEVVVKACARDAANRYRDCEAMHAELALLDGGGSVERKRRLEQVWRLSWKAGVVAVLVVLAISAMLRFASRGTGDAHIQPKNPKVKKLMDEALGVGYALNRQDETVKLFEEAIGLEPTFAPAWAGLLIRSMGKEPIPEVTRKLKLAADKLKELAPYSSERHAAQGIVKWMDWRFTAALEDARLATQKPEILIGGIVFARTIYGFDLLQVGRVHEAMKQFELAEAGNGGDPFVQFGLGQAYFVKRQFGEALKRYQTCLKLQPKWPPAQYCRGRVFEEQKAFVTAIQEFEVADLWNGRDEAQTKAYYRDLWEAFHTRGEDGYWQKRLEIAQKESPQNPYLIATLYARLRRLPEAYGKLREAWVQKSDSVWAELMSDLCWDHQDREFQEIARDVGLLR